MLTNWWLILSSTTVFLLGTATLGALVYRQSIRYWPFLFVSIALDLATTAALAILMHHYSAYFYTYWVAAGLQALLHLGIVLDIARSFPRFKEIPAGMWAFCGIFALILGTALASYSVHTPQPLGTAILTFVLNANRAVSIVWLGVLVGALFPVKLIGFPWADDGVYVCWAMLLQIAPAAIAAEMLVHQDPTVRLWAGGIDALSRMASAGMLSYAFFPVQRDRENTLPDPAADPTVAEAVEKLLTHIRRELER